ncbi:Uncharacterised protein [Mycobacteroides abscessus subsp. abscessus]|nr:Uncharacterised protein [Mycobacteroides abscessus subsp. abscessus]
MLITCVRDRSHPSSAQARLADDTVGSTRTRSRPTALTIVDPTPWNIGSPLASTCTVVSETGESEVSDSTCCRCSDIGERHATVVASSSGRSSSWRVDPYTTVALRNSSRTRSVSPAQPSAPIPTTTNSGVSVVATVIGATCARSRAVRTASRIRRSAVVRESTPPNDRGGTPVPRRRPPARRRPTSALAWCRRP